MCINQKFSIFGNKKTFIFANFIVQKFIFWHFLNFMSFKIFNLLPHHKFLMFFCCLNRIWTCFTFLARVSNVFRCGSGNLSARVSISRPPFPGVKLRHPQKWSCPLRGRQSIPRSQSSLKRTRHEFFSLFREAECERVGACSKQTHCILRGARIQRSPGAKPLSKIGEGGGSIAAVCPLIRLGRRRSFCSTVCRQGLIYLNVRSFFSGVGI